MLWFPCKQMPNTPDLGSKLSDFKMFLFDNDAKSCRWWWVRLNMKKKRRLKWVSTIYRLFFVVGKWMQVTKIKCTVGRDPCRLLIWVVASSSFCLFWSCWNRHKTVTFKELWWWSFSLQSLSFFNCFYDCSKEGVVGSFTYPDLSTRKWEGKAKLARLSPLPAPPH